MVIKGILPWRHSTMDPLSFFDLQNDATRILRGVLREFAAPGEEEWGSFSPRVNVTENETGLRVSAELPGVEEKDIDVTVADGVLSIKGKRDVESEEKDRTTYRWERSLGSFERVIPLPYEVDEEKIVAKYSKGVLVLSVPRAPDVKQTVRRIAIQSE